MTESMNGLVEGTDTSRIKDVKPKGKGKGNQTSSLDGYFAKARKRATKKNVTFKGSNDDGVVSLTVKSFPGFTEEDVCVAAEGGVTVAVKINKKVKGKAATCKEDGKGDEGYEMAEDFFAIETNAE